MKSKQPHDPFHDDEPQVSNVYQYRKTPDLRPLKDAGGGLNPKPLEITDEAFDSDFVPTREPERVYYKKGKK